MLIKSLPPKRSRSLEDSGLATFDILAGVQRRLPGLALAAAVVILLSGCGGGKSEEAERKEGDHKKESRVTRGTNDEVILKLDQATRTAMDLKTEKLKPEELSQEVKGFGRVLDASGLAASAADLKTAQAASAASQAELARLKTLAAQNNASQRALEAAESAAARDQAQLEAVRLRLTATWGNAIASRADLADFAQALARLEQVLVLINLPAGESLPAPPTGARISALGDTNLVLAQLLGPAPAVDAQLQGPGFLALATSNSFRLVPGAAVTGFLIVPGEKAQGVALPADAVVRFNGLAWVYVETGEETFERRAVKLETPLKQGWFLKSGLRPGDQVVVNGAQQLLSEELKRDEAE